MAAEAEEPGRLGVCRVAGGLPRRGMMSGRPESSVPPVGGTGESPDRPATGSVRQDPPRPAPGPAPCPEPPRPAPGPPVRPEPRAAPIRAGTGQTAGPEFARSDSGLVDFAPLFGPLTWVTVAVIVVHRPKP